MERAAVFALGRGEARQEVLVDTAEGVLGLVFLRAKADAAEETDEAAGLVFEKVLDGVVAGGQVGDEVVAGRVGGDGGGLPEGALEAEIACTTGVLCQGTTSHGSSWEAHKR